MATDDKCESTWAEWQQWSSYYPSCINEYGLFSDLDKHSPQRYRQRDCKIGTNDRNYTIIGITGQICKLTGNCWYCNNWL